MEAELDYDVAASPVQTSRPRSNRVTDADAPRVAATSASVTPDASGAEDDDGGGVAAGVAALNTGREGEKRQPTAEETLELLRACEARDKAAVFELACEVRADGQDPIDARTPLHAAIASGSEDIVILLLSTCPGTAPLLLLLLSLRQLTDVCVCACVRVRVRETEIDVNKQDRGGATPLHEAVQFASDDIVDILLTSASHINVRCARPCIIVIICTL
jgi:hypothetical protein